MHNDKESTPGVRFQSYNCDWANVTSSTGQRIHEVKVKNRSKRNPDRDLASTTTCRIGKEIQVCSASLPRFRGSGLKHLGAPLKSWGKENETPMQQNSRRQQEIEELVKGIKGKLAKRSEETSIHLTNTFGSATYSLLWFMFDIFSIWQAIITLVKSFFQCPANLHNSVVYQISWN